MSSLGFPGGSVGKETVCNAGDPDLIPGTGRFPGGEHGNPLQYSCLGHPRGAWWTTVHGVSEELGTTESAHTHISSLEKCLFRSSAQFFD